MFGGLIIDLDFAGVAIRKVEFGLLGRGAFEATHRAAKQLFLLSNPPLLVLVQKLAHRRARGHLAVFEEKRPLVEKNDPPAIVIHHFEDRRSIALCRDALEGDKAMVVHALVALEPFVQLDALVVVRVAPRPAAIDLGECVELKKAKQDLR